MKLYEVEAVRWYYSAIFYRVVADSYDEAYEKCDLNIDEDGIIEFKASDLEWNGEEEILHNEMLKTVHDMNLEDDLMYDHTKCKYLGNTIWNCGHKNLPDLDDSRGVQLSLWPLTESWEKNGND